MKILVINSGSSSIKYQLIEMKGRTVLASGLVERIGEEASVHNHMVTRGGVEEKEVIEKPVADHQQGLAAIIDLLCSKTGVVADSSEISAIGHRVVHGGEAFHEPTLIDDEVIASIKKHIPLAPLHNPANLKGIETARKLFPEVSQVAVFDTAFHQTMPDYAYHYAIPHEFYEKNDVRRYGFHGTSHHYVAKQAAAHLKLDPKEGNFIVLHLGNGASASAVRGGESIDTSMGLTPLEGLIMGTRSGDMDPAIHFYLAEQTGKTMPEIEKVFNKQSGLKGICGDNDMRAILERAGKGDDQANLAINMYCYRIKKYIGAYAAALGRVDAVVFTAGVGEKAVLIREKCCEDMAALGMELDSKKNSKLSSGVNEIQSTSSKLKILVVPTNEELEIAEQTLTKI